MALVCVRVCVFYSSVMYSGAERHVVASHDAAAHDGVHPQWALLSFRGTHTLSLIHTHTHKHSLISTQLAARQGWCWGITPLSQHCGSVVVSCTPLLYHVMHTSACRPSHLCMPPVTATSVLSQRCAIAQHSAACAHTPLQPTSLHCCCYCCWGCMHTAA